MKRKLLAAALALTMCLTPYTSFAAEETTETADASSVTAEEILKKQADFAQNAESLSADMDMNFDLSLIMSMAGEDGTSQDYGTGMKFNGNMRVDALMKPLTAAVTGTLNMEVDTEKQSLDMAYYMTTSEDETKMDIYTNNPEDPANWIHSVMDMTEMLEQFNVSSLSELQSMSDTELMGDIVAWDLSETDSSYELSGQVKLGDMTDTILPLVEQSVQSSLSASGMDMDMATIEPIITTILDCFVINISYTVDKETCAAQTVHIDFNDSDLSAITELVKVYLAAAGMSEEDGFTFSLDLNEFTVDAAYSYNSVDEITIPEEALNAETVDMNELMAEASEEMAE